MAKQNPNPSPLKAESQPSPEKEIVQNQFLTVRPFKADGTPYVSTPEEAHLFHVELQRSEMKRHKPGEHPFTTEPFIAKYTVNEWRQIVTPSNEVNGVPVEGSEPFRTLGVEKDWSFILHVAIPKK